MTTASSFRSFQIDATKLGSWDAFHSVFAETFEFPGWYGRNLNAWIDCMTHLDAGGPVEPGDLVLLEFANLESLRKRSPEILDFIFEGSAFVNGRRRELGESPLIVVSDLVKRL